MTYSYKNKEEIHEGFGRGPRGSQGSIGKKGDNGERGIPGIRGPPGPFGAKGDKGNKGPVGNDGPIGPAGPLGSKGDRGFDGFPGPQGKLGPRGDSGKTGPAGPRGLEGKSGQNGKAGTRGFPGLKGEPGTFGENSCMMFGSDVPKGWQCPDSHPVYSGATMGGNGSKLYCSGGIAKNASCNGGSGTGAKAKVFVNAGQIADIKITNGGRNYKYPPHIRVIATKGYGAILKAEVSNNSVNSISIIDGGQDYTEPPELQFETVDAGYGATASTIIDNGRVVAVNMVHTGQNYLIPPEIEFRGGGGKGAAAISEINEGHVISVRISSGGAGYTYSPIVVITPGASKTGCNFCHMCCKKNPESAKDAHGSDTSIQQQYESRIEQTENQIQKINDMLYEQQNMLQLSLESGQKIQEEPKKKREKIAKNITSERKNINDMIINAAENTKGIDLEELDKYRKQLSSKDTSKDSLTEEQKVNRLSKEQKRLKPRKYKNWAKNGKANQSSTKDNHIADKAIDGNLDTFNMTNIEINGNTSWIQVKLPKNIEISKIKVSNRLGSYTIRDRLPPFTIEVYNKLGAKVGSKRFSKIQNEYIWSNVSLVGEIVKIVHEERNYLHVSDISVFGEPALSCSEYEERHSKYRNLVDQILLDPKGLKKTEENMKGDKDLYIKNRRLYKSLMDSCSKLDKETSEEKTQLVQERAAAYDKILEKNKALLEAKSKKAKKLWDKMQQHKDKEDKTAKEAKKLGLPPPPPMYSQSQIDVIKRNIEITTPNLTLEEKATCMYLLNDAMKKRTAAEDYGRKAASMPILIHTAKKAAKHADKAWKRYTKQCDPTASVSPSSPLD
uniref:Uncharacterized protein n=1 Tax=viral metagenome TaxID=1070528 RepID=A0A6C0JAL0_9ZZZZ